MIFSVQEENVEKNKQKRNEINRLQNSCVRG